MCSVEDTFRQGSRLVFPYLHLSGRHEPIAPDIRLEQGVELLESIPAPKFLEVHWLLGKAYEATGGNEESVRCFRDAYGQDNGKKEVVHEYIIALLRLGRKVEALEIAMQSDTDDPLLLFDRALALFAVGEFKASNELLSSIRWPESFRSRVVELKRRIAMNE